ncbi:MAG: YibE/F family protein [Bacillota bacterium]
MRIPQRTLYFALLFFFLFTGSTAFANFADEPQHFFRGKVISVEDVVSAHPFATLDQEAEVLLTSGPFRGESVFISSTYIENDYFLNVYLEKGTEIILVASVEDGVIKEAYLHDIARDRGLYYLLAAFILLLLLVGRMQGLKTVITLVFTGIVIMKVILPLLLLGYEPIPVATFSAIVIIVFTFLIIGGVNAKSFSAILGTVCGVTVAGLLALWVGEISHLTGFNSEEAQMLSFMEQTINIRGLLFAGIIIGSLGAVTDVGMSVASAASEISCANPHISPYQLTRAALNVGRDIMGTMSNTLVLAYVGSAMPLLLLLLGYEMEWLKIINLDLIATEFVRGIAGSIGLIVAIPVTAAAAGFMMSRKK